MDGINKSDKRARPASKGNSIELKELDELSASLHEGTQPHRHRASSNTKSLHGKSISQSVRSSHSLNKMIHDPSSTNLSSTGANSRFNAPLPPPRLSLPYVIKFVLVKSLALLAVLLVMLTVAEYDSDLRELKSHEMMKMRGITEQLRSHLRYFRRLTVDYALTVSRLCEFEVNGDCQHLDLVNNYLYSSINNQLNCDLVRYVNDTGFEMALVKRPAIGSAPRIYPSNELNDISNRYYYPNLQDLAFPIIFDDYDHPVYSSPLDLMWNYNTNAPYLPIRPVVRYGVKVVKNSTIIDEFIQADHDAGEVLESAGEHQGYLVLYVNMQPMLDIIKKTSRSESTTWVANGAGFFAVAPDPSLEYGWLFGNTSDRYSFKSYYPDEYTWFQAHRSSKVLHDGQVQLDAHDAVITMLALSPDHPMCGITYPEGCPAIHNHVASLSGIVVISVAKLEYLPNTNTVAILMFVTWLPLQIVVAWFITVLYLFWLNKKRIRIFNEQMQIFERDVAIYRFEKAKLLARRLKTKLDEALGNKDKNVSIEVDLESPFEKAMNLLKDLKDKGEIDSDIADHVIELLSKSHIFAPKIEEQLADGTLAVDDETREYLLYELVQSKLAGNNHSNQDPTRSTLSILAPNTVPSIPVTPTLLQIRTPASVINTSSSLAVLTDDDAHEDKQSKFVDIFSHVIDFSFSIFDAEDVTHSKALVYTTMFVLERYSVIDDLALDRAVLRRYLTIISTGYMNNDGYHCASHAADVVAATAALIEPLAQTRFLSSIDILSLVLAAAVHDYKHPQLTSPFLIATRHELALTYNERSVLENYHVSEAIKLMEERDASNVVGLLPKEMQSFVRKRMIECVLATDMKQHFEVLGSFKSRVVGADVSATQASISNTKVPDEIVALVSQVAIKLADIGHTAKALSLHLKWTERLNTEFFAQGDRERAMAMPISPFMDRTNANVPKSQRSFIAFVVQPLFEAWHSFSPIPAIMTNLKNNTAYWASQETASNQ